MSYIIGIDIGGSTTKIVGLRDGTVAGATIVKASDPLTSAYGAFGKFLAENRLTIREIGKVMCTGVGSSFIQEDIYGIPTEKVDEFRAIGLGGRYISGLQHCIVVSMGTGTAITSVNGEEIVYVGGTGVGGGTLVGLCQRLVGTDSYEHISELASHGQARKVDLSVGDITHDQLANMKNKTTASNFGKVSDDATDADYAMGVVNLVFQTIGIFAKMAAEAHKTDKIVLTGSLTRMGASQTVINDLEELYGVQYLVPEHSEYSTAIGAALYGKGE